MNFKKPKVYLIGETKINKDAIQKYLNDIDTPHYTSDAPSDSEYLSEFYGRLCYRSFKPGLNPNVTKTRTGNNEYLKHVLDVNHGSILEHSTLNFIFKDVTRIFTHELCRHRVGTAISQESLRYVRLTDISAYNPVVLQNNEEALFIFENTMRKLEEVQQDLSTLTDIDNLKDFKSKKHLTSAFRRVAPMGICTTIGWSCNLRTLRHVIQLRTDPAAEEEIRFVFNQVYNIVKDKYPNVFQDFVEEEIDGFKWIYKK